MDRDDGSLRERTCGLHRLAGSHPETKGANLRYARSSCVEERRPNREALRSCSGVLIRNGATGDVDCRLRNIREEQHELSYGPAIDCLRPVPRRGSHNSQDTASGGIQINAFPSLQPQAVDTESLGAFICSHHHPGIRQHASTSTVQIVK
jgi:hypothetical protein